MIEKDSNRVKQLKRDHEDSDEAPQLAVIVELAPLLTLSSVKSEGQRRALVENVKSSMTVALNRVSLLAQKTRDPGMKQWCEQIQVVFGDFSGVKYSPQIGRTASPMPCTAPMPARPSGPTKGTISHDNHKWTISGFIQQSEPVEICSVEGEAEIDQRSSICICDCQDTIFKISSQACKVTAISIDKCKGVGVILDGDVIGTVEIVNGKKCQLQVSGHLPAVNIDSSETVTVFLSSQSAGVNVITSRCTEINLIHPVGWAAKKMVVKEPGVVRKVRKVLRKKAKTSPQTPDAVEEGVISAETEALGISDDGLASSSKEDDKQDECSEEAEDYAEDEYEEVDEEYEEEEEFERVEEDAGPVETTEVAIPVQFRSFFSRESGVLITEPVQHAGN